MKTNWAAVGWGVMAWLALLPACSEGEADPDPHAEYCEALCGVYQRCEAVDAIECARWCVIETGRFAAATNPQALELTAECLPSRSCAEQASGEFVDICLEQIAPHVDPTATLVDFCEEISPTWFDCGYLADVHYCIENFNLWSDPRLERARECAPLGCEESDACLDEVFSG